MPQIITSPAASFALAAILLTLTALAKGREVIVSRGEQVQIGGGFRIPEILKLSGAGLVEVGTTNITTADDYLDAEYNNQSSPSTFIVDSTPESTVSGEPLSAFHIEDPDHLIDSEQILALPKGQHEPIITKGWLKEGPMTIAVTAGASTPNAKIGQVIEKILAIRGENNS